MSNLKSSKILSKFYQNFFTQRWVNSKVVDGKSKGKSRLVTRGFQEDNYSILSSSPT